MFTYRRSHVSNFLSHRSSLSLPALHLSQSLIAPASKYFQNLYNTLSGRQPFPSITIHHHPSQAFTDIHFQNRTQPITTITTIMQFSTAVLGFLVAVTGSLAAPLDSAVLTPTTTSAAAFSFGGDGTYFATGLGSCGTTNKASDYIVAISHLRMDQTKVPNPNNNVQCGEYILLIFYRSVQT